jgi:Dolichyl-phosphate-mannose-protein mannosyltransferase
VGSAATKKIALSVILAGALALRLASIGWGLPPAIPEVKSSDIRSSYAFDEDDVLTPVSFMDASKLNFDPRDYHWGTLYFELMLPWMGAAEALGFFAHPWRTAYYDLIPGDFDRVYIVGRFLSVMFSLLSIVATYLLGRDIAGATAGLWAAALVAASPTHLLNATQIRVDIAMVALLTLCAWMWHRPSAWASLWHRPSACASLTGILGGLAVSAKYTAALGVLVIVLVSRARPIVLAGIVLGFLIGEPYVVARAPAVYEQLATIVRNTRALPPQYALPAPVLVAKQAMNLARFSIGPVGTALALAGLWRLARRHSRADWLILALTGAMAFSLIPLVHPLLRYQLPLLPFLAVAAGAALTSLPPIWRWSLGALAIIFPVAASLAQVSYMRAEHPANRVLAVILKSVPAGTPIARLAPELPPLDRKIYPQQQYIFTDDLTRNPPAWALTANLPDTDYPSATRALLAARFDIVGEFSTPRLFPWATFGESGAPHDWKYTHPAMVLYRRRDQ